MFRSRMFAVVSATAVLAGLFSALAGAQQPHLQVKLSVDPAMVEVGQKTKVAAVVTLGGKPVEGAEVVFEAGGGEFATSGKAVSKPSLTNPQGVSSDRWSYSKREFARGYVLAAKVKWKDDTARAEAMVRVVVAKAEALKVTLKAQPAIVEVGQRTRLVATVMRDSKPLEGAEVVFEAGGGAFGSSGKAASKPATTNASGTCADTWSYPNKDFAKGGYNLAAKVTWKSETGRGEFLVRVVPRIE